MYALQVLDALGESLPCANYDSWMVYVPEGEFLSHIGPTEFYKVNSQSYLLILKTNKLFYNGIFFSIIYHISKEYV